jgi:transposase-like protein
VRSAPSKEKVVYPAGIDPMRPRAPNADVAAIESILAFAEARQAGARSALVRDLRFALPAREPDARVPSLLIPRLLPRAVLLLRQPDFGLRLAAVGDPRRHGLLDYLAATSPTLGAVWLQICRYLSLWNEGVGIRATATPIEAVLEIHPAPAADEPEGLRQLLGLAGATLVLMGHRFAGRPVLPRHVELACACPADPEPWGAAFGAPVSFAVPLTRIVYPSSAAEITGAAADPSLARILGRHADELLARLGDRTRWSDRIREAIVARLRGGDVQIAAIATAMAVSVRTLQRRLREEGTSFESAPSCKQTSRRTGQIIWFGEPNQILAQPGNTYPSRVSMRRNRRDDRFNLRTAASDKQRAQDRH